MKIRQTREEDYEQLVGWWSDNRFSPVPQIMLPDNGKCGLMVYKGDRNICAGFLYFTNSPIVWQEFLVADFNYREPDRKEALHFLINELAGLAERKGAKVIFTSVKNPGLIKHFEECGFKIGSSGTKEMIRNLNV